MRRDLVAVLSLLSACVARSDDFRQHPAATDPDTDSDAPSCAYVDLCGNARDDDCDGLLDEGCARTCGTLASLTDSFDDDVRGAVWEWSWLDDGALTESDGALRLTHPAGDAGAAYVTSDVFGTDGSEITVKLRSSTVREAGSSFAITLINGRDEVAYITQVADVVYVGYAGAGSTTDLAPVPADFSSQRWWRLGTLGGAIYGQTSPDGSTWTEIGRAQLPFVLGMTHVAIQLAGSGAGAAEVHVEQVNGPGSGAFPDCSFELLVDELDDGHLDPLWVRSFENGPAQLEESGGVVTIAPAPNTGSNAGLYASNRYSLAEASVTAKVVSVLTHDPSHESSFRLDDPRGTIGGFAVRNGRMLAYYDAGARQELADIPFDPAAHICWRFRGDGDEVVWELAGADCTGFIELARLASMLSVRTLAPMLFAAAYSSSPNPGSMIIERVFGQRP